MEIRSIKFIEHRANDMKTKRSSCIRKTALLNFAFAWLTLSFSQPAYPQESEAAPVVYRLYHDFGWEALFASPDDAQKFLGPTLLMQPKEILANYFDNELVLLFLKEADCVKKKPGKLCKLEFNPIFASQDSSASELSIKRATPTSIDVEFSYPANHEKIRVSYDMTKTSKGWKIADIEYTDSHTSLKRLLSK